MDKNTSIIINETFKKFLKDPNSLTNKEKKELTKKDAVIIEKKNNIPIIMFSQFKFSEDETNKLFGVIENMETNLPMTDKEIEELIKKGAVIIDDVEPRYAPFTSFDFKIEKLNGINATLQERGKRYGEFENHAYITQDYKNLLRQQLNEKNKCLKRYHQEALDMIFHKIGRIVNGDPDYADSWIDIAGYAKLVADIIEKKDKK